MELIKRQLHDTIEHDLFKGKAILLIGARQVGKSTLFNQVLENRDEPILRLNCDEPQVRDNLSNINTAELGMIIGNNRIVLIDEAQRVKNIGITLKLITDNFPDVQLLVTGSSSFQLLDTINEPLTGRKWEYHLFPLSTPEILKHGGLLSLKQNFENRLIYGSYPDVFNHADTARKTLTNLSGSYLYKDLLSLDYVRKPALLEKLLVALALQIGSEVSYNELAQTLNSDAKTVEKYIDLLEKCYIIFRLHAFNRNIRTELKKGRKIYFYDNGIRNAIIQNFSPLSLRNDVGPLWENFFISERIKANHYNENYAKSYFWRTTQQQEIDYIEEIDGRIHAFEMKWNPKKSASLPSAFKEKYDVASFSIITPDNYTDFL
ncbi:MAG: ATP-binding protein [Muribaculaceae bacterium]|nr:ATP-binding protein [Muribaculaceae bacterium]